MLVSVARKASVEDKLRMSRCDSYGTFVIPPKPYCVECLGQSSTWVELPGTATIYTFYGRPPPLHRGPADVVPYVTGIIDVDDTRAPARG
jgi:uncharacterized protein